VNCLTIALQIDDVVIIGGGKVDKLEGPLPPQCHKGYKDNAFCWGFLMWKEKTNARHK
jgi:hypothetical protein